MLKNPTGVIRGKIHGHSRHVSPALLQDAGYCKRAMVDESGMIRTYCYMGSHNISEMVPVYGTPCAIPPCN
jgi:hypothetical protein